MTEFIERAVKLEEWRESYPGATFELITPDRYLDFIG
jgi:hypothetical protein